MADALKTDFKIQMVDLVTQHGRIKHELDEAIHKVLAHGAFINGPEVKLFAENLAGYLGVKNVVPCANGTDALQIALMALDLKPGDEVITASFNYVAAAEACALLGLKPVFAECDKVTFNLDADLLEGYITPKTKAVIVVHLFGQACDMEKIMAVAEKHKLYIIEDVAQSLGCEINYKEHWVKAGTIGHIGTTSFFPTKNLGCMGDGGAIYTNHDALAAKCKSIATHGQGQRYEFQLIGMNSRLDTLQAAMLNVKLDSLKHNLLQRKHWAEKYDELLAGMEGILLPVQAESSTHSYNQYVVKVSNNKRDALKKFLADSGVPTMVYYPKPLHLQPAYAYLGYKEGDLSISGLLCNEVLALPIHPELTEEQILYIIEKIKAFFHAA